MHNVGAPVQTSGLRVARRRSRFVVVRVGAAAILGLVVGASPARAESATDKVDRLFAKWNTRDSPGCSLGVSRDGTTVYEHGYGMANLDLGGSMGTRVLSDRSLSAASFVFCSREKLRAARTARTCA